MDEIPADLRLRHFNALERFRIQGLQTAPPSAGSIALRPWQGTLMDKLKSEPDSRELIFALDEEGGAGKTTFARYVLEHLQNVQYFRPGKRQDIAHMLRPDVRIIICDVPRAKIDCMDWAIWEEIKDGMVFSPKYDSHMKIVTKVPHVVFLVNSMPPEFTFSRDRICVIECSK